MDRRSWVLLYALAGTWGASYLLIKIGLRDLSPVWVAWGRTLLAALVLLPFAAHRGALRGLGARWRVVGLLGFVQVVVPFTMISWGDQEVPTALIGLRRRSIRRSWRSGSTTRSAPRGLGWWGS